MANTDEQSTSLSYQKRIGVSGIRGALYETKLLSLIYFKALHDDDIEEFFLATHVAETGVFDDICLRVKFKGYKKPISVFVLTRHWENNLSKVMSKKDLAYYFASYLKIKRRFQPNNADVLFRGSFSDTDCVFVMYTTAKDDGNSKPCEGSLVTYLNNMIRTGNPGSQPSYTDEELDLLCQQVMEEELIILAQQVVKYMFDDVRSQMMMDNELVSKYHVVLARHVFDISEIQPEGHRIASFRDDFFRQSQKYIQVFKDALCSYILTRQKIDINNEMEDLMADFLSDPENRTTLCKFIRGSVMTFKNGKLEFNQMIPPHMKLLLDIINNKEYIRDEAVELAVRECKPSLEFKVPAVFGNKDLAIKGSDEKIDRRLDYLCNKLIDWMEKCKPDNIVTIDESIDERLLRLNSGFASAIGNIFVFDDKSALFKFCENYESLGNIAQRFFTKLESQVENMHDYRFKMSGKMLPKVSLDRTVYHEEVKDFVSKFVFYTSQGNEHDVGEKVKDEIKKYQDEFHNPEIRSEAIFLKYHDEISKWWMTPNEASYLTKDDKFYKNAVFLTDDASVRI